MKFAKIQTIASVVGIVTSANANGIRNDQGSEREDEDQQRDRERNELAAHEVVAEHGVEVVLDRRLPRQVDGRAGDRAHRPAHLVGPALGVGGSRSETIWATVTSCVTGCTLTRRLVASSATARPAAARTSGTSARAIPSLRTTIVNDPVERCPKWSWRMTSARRVSVPGRVKRFVSRPESWTTPPRRRRTRSARRRAPRIGAGGRVVSSPPRARH